MAASKFTVRNENRKLTSVRRLAGRYWQAEPLLEFAARGWVADLDAVLSVIREMLDNGRPEEVADDLLDLEAFFQGPDVMRAPLQAA